MGFLFNHKDREKSKTKDRNAVQGALEDAGQALQGDPLQQAVNKKKNNR
ncbi:MULTISPECIES: small acid-soluble spore protein SspJ [Bacillus]|nr:MULTISPECIES: small acid-soluble spore protein SspJ [Bacillus]QHZ45615.1 small, acid-soluble spore protein, SspJ family [Bacillus sp. NSP9.1]WFA04581.1 small acid-soluble spore protein SspJ [Bacillus sp. HSf4]